jgi:tetratricopeptide (TPR) repeat protein
MKAVTVRIFTVGMIVLLGLPTLTFGAPAAKKKAPVRNVSVPAADVQGEKPLASTLEIGQPSGTATPLDEQWSADNKVLLEMARDKKILEAITKGNDMLSSLKARNKEGGPEAATTYNNIGMLHVNGGQLDKGLENLMKALELRRKLFGDNSIEAALVWKNLSELYKVQARAIRDKKLDEELAKAQSTLDGLSADKKESIEAAAAHNAIGAINLSRGQIGIAQQHLLQALVLYGKLTGDKSPELASVSQNLSELYRVQAQSIVNLHQKEAQKAAAADTQKK